MILWNIKKQKMKSEKLDTIKQNPKKTYQEKLKIDMSFNEALEKIAKFNSKEVKEVNHVDD